MAVSALKNRKQSAFGSPRRLVRSRWFSAGSGLVLSWTVPRKTEVRWILRTERAQSMSSGTPHSLSPIAAAVILAAVTTSALLSFALWSPQPYTP